MPQFVIPQFIDVEDKIIGPVTVRQFIMSVVVILLIFLSYRVLDFIQFILATVALVVLYIVVAFIKVNGRPSYYFVANMILSFKRPGLRVWNKETTVLWQAKAHEANKVGEAAPVIPRKRLVEQELSQLALLVDTGGRYRPERILAEQRKRKQ